MLLLYKLGEVQNVKGGCSVKWGRASSIVCDGLTHFPDPIHYEATQLIPSTTQRALLEWKTENIFVLYSFTEDGTTSQETRNWL
jgi:hypothetical protein